MIKLTARGMRPSESMLVSSIAKWVIDQLADWPAGVLAMHVPSRGAMTSITSLAMRLRRSLKLSSAWSSVSRRDNAGE